MLNRREPTLQERIASREAVVGIVGMGYVGLPLALAFGERGFPVLGFEIDPAKVEALGRGESYIRHIDPRRVRSLAVGEGGERPRLQATTDASRAREADALLLCVPTPLTPAREPDLSFIEAAGRAIGPHLRSGQLVVLESSTWPGTTDEVLRPLLERLSGLRAGVDFYLAFSPEREDPGNPRFDTRTIPKVVGGHGPMCAEVACLLYGAAIDQVVRVRGTREAELTKLLENIFRCVNIALVNELKLLCERMEIDLWEVIDAAATKPFGFMPFHPGPGLGGHCIPIDPFYLSWKARQYEFQTRFIELAGEINWQMPYHVVERTAAALSGQGKPLKGARVLLCGVAYKKNIDDLRESPALRILELLRQRGAKVAYHDPFIPALEVRHGKEPLRLQSVALGPAALESDAAVVVTDHDGVDYAQLVRDAPLVVDTRNATRGVTFGRDKIHTA